MTVDGMGAKAKIGVTGTGGLGTLLARGIDELDDAEVVAVTDVSEANRTRAAEEFDVSAENRFEDHEEMLDTVDLDGVTIATPHAFHYEQTVAALERGIDTLCEKPLCIDLENAKDLVRRSETGDATLMLGYQRHLAGAYRRARTELGDTVGDPQFLTAEVTQDWISGQRGSWRADPDLSGGGQLYDTGSHLLDVVLWTTGLTPESVNAQMLFDDDENRVDKQAALDVKFANGAVASVSVSGDTPSVREHLHVWGDNGAFYVDGKDWAPRELTYIDADNEEREPSIEEYDAGDKPEAFIDVVRNGSDPPATARDALKVTAVTEAAYESARTGKRVDIDIPDVEAVNE
jgi:predicted dehydrogenase